MSEEPMIKVFEYLPTVNAFATTDEYSYVAERLKLGTNNPVDWIGRHLCLEMDEGRNWLEEVKEHPKKEFAREHGLKCKQLYLLDPNFFIDTRVETPYNSGQLKAFWINVLQSLAFSIDTLCEEARFQSDQREDDRFDESLEGAIADIRQKYL